MPYATDGNMGVDLDAVTAGTTTDGAGAPMTLGAKVTGTDGTTWLFVQAGSAITQYDCVGIDENYQAVPLTDAIAGAGHMIGFAQVAFADNEFGWVAIEGSNIQCRVAASVVQDTQLWSFTVAGVLEDASTAGAIEIHGVVAVASVSTATTNTEIIARAPYATWTDL